MKRILPLLLILMIFLVPFVSAGVGIKWDKESLLVNEGDEDCMTYSVYNPWPEDSYVEIEVSDELKEVLVMQEAETKFVPSNTPSTEAIPIEFCFDVPRVYERDCWIGSLFICEQTCSEEQKVYEGDVIIKSAQDASDSGSGSSTAMSVSAPLNIKVRCNPSSRDFTLIYGILIVICLVVIIPILIKKYKKPNVMDMKNPKGVKIK